VGTDCHLLGTNVVGPWLFTDLLAPLLEKTAAQSPAGTVRVLWAGSFVVEAGSPTDGVQFENDAPKVFNFPARDYGQSKAANVLLAREFMQRHAGKNIISLAFNPGNLQTELQRHTPALITWVFNRIMLHPARFGAYTELWAGWSEDVKGMADGKVYAVPWGRNALPETRADIVKALEEGVVGKKLWDWCAGETKAFR